MTKLAAIPQGWPRLPVDFVSYVSAKTATDYHSALLVSEYLEQVGRGKAGTYFGGGTCHKDSEIVGHLNLQEPPSIWISTL
jgi:hypothetical protein